MKKPTDFKKGEVYRFSPGYYEDKPYYAVVCNVGKQFIETYIPGLSKLLICDSNWEYQTKRMTYVGNNIAAKRKLYNQKLNGT